MPRALTLVSADGVVIKSNALAGLAPGARLVETQAPHSHALQLVQRAIVEKRAYSEKIRDAKDNSWTVDVWPEADARAFVMVTADQQRDDVLVRRIVHELRNIGFGLLTTFEMLHDGEPTTDERAALDTVRTLIERLPWLTGALELIARSSTGAVPSAVAVAVDAASERVRNVSLVRTGDERAMVLADADALVASLAYLIENAGAVSAGAPVRVDTSVNESSVRIAVHDRGPALPADAEQVWSPACRRRKGHLGVGVALVKRLVAGMGGTVSARPLPDGAELAIVLRRA